MKVVLLAGGLGTRISEESQFKPKPMIEIGGKPILWHIMKEYSYYGFNDFVICAGYKQYVIKEWFDDYFLHNSDITFDFTDGVKKVIVHSQHCEPWRVTVVDTGLNTMTGGRIKRIQSYIGDEPFMMTYGDGVCDVNIQDLLKFHQTHGKIATLTAVIQEQQKGVLDIGGDNAVAVGIQRTQKIHPGSRALGVGIHAQYSCQQQAHGHQRSKQPFQADSSFPIANLCGYSTMEPKKMQGRDVFFPVRRRSVRRRLLGCRCVHTRLSAN